MEKIYNGDWAKFRSAVIFAGAVPSKDSGVAMFNSLSFESFGDRWGIAATDRYRLAWVGVNLSADEFRHLSPDYRALISAPDLVKAVKPVKVSAWHLFIDEDRREWSLNVDGSKFGGELVNGDFPKWRQLTPLSLDSAGENLAGGINYDPSNSASLTAFPFSPRFSLIPWICPVYSAPKPYNCHSKRARLIINRVRSSLFLYPPPLYLTLGMSVCIRLLITELGVCRQHYPVGVSIILPLHLLQMLGFNHGRQTSRRRRMG
jgi:hypothetical protein